MGFATVDRQPRADATAVWITSRTGDNFVRNTNAVVIAHDDPEYRAKVRALTIGHSVVLTEGSTRELPFTHAVGVDVFEYLIEATARLQDHIAAAITEYAERKNATLVVPKYLPVPELVIVEPDEPRFRALATANYLVAVWTAWLFTEEQRQRRTISPRTQETPWIMPAELNSPIIAALPAAFADRVKPEPQS